jgi:hypothetical protein
MVALVIASWRRPKEKSARFAGGRLVRRGSLFLEQDAGFKHRTNLI